MARIYVSSTFSDLKEYRDQVNKALERLGHANVAMEYYVAGDERPLDRCLADVASCQLYVGIFAWRYGYIPQENNPAGRSITELEYHQAQAAGIPCLIFLLAEDAPWPRTKQDKGAAADQIESLRQDLCQRHVVDFFAGADELARKVNEAVVRWEKESGLVGQRQLTDWDAYRQALINKHQWVRMQVIAGAGKDRGIARIPLTAVFEPQLIVAGTPGSDVPEAVRKYQEEIYGPRQPTSDEPLPPETAEAEDAEETITAETEGALLAGNPELVLDMLGREATQVILGGPGAGKSTILHYAMLKLCQAGAAAETLPLHLQDAPIPFLVELRNYILQQEKAPDFVRYLIQQALSYYDVSIDAGSLTALLGQESKALIFFDGLDEIFDPDERRQVLDQFQTFAHRYPQTRIVVTSRIAGYDKTALGLAGFEHYTLLPLTLGQIRHFATQWYQYYTLEGTERTAQGLVQRIIESPRLLDLAGNPLLLTMMAVIYKDRDLPTERWRLYQRCAETLLEDWELGKGIEIEDFKLAVHIRTAQKAEILQRVAMYMLEHQQPGRELNAVAYAPLLDIVATYLEEKYQRSRGEAEAIAVDILRHLMEHTYVLAGIGERVFGFVHRTFMEYFAACRCQAQFNARKSDFVWLTRDLFGAHWQASEWEEVLLLLIAMLHDQGTPIRDVVEYLRSECRTPLPFNVAFAARCLGEAGDIQAPAQGQTLLGELALAINEYAAQSRKAEARILVETALKAFAALGPLVTAPAGVQVVIDQLNQSGLVAGRIAAWQMGFALRSRKERLDYALAALQDPEAVVRRGALAALEREWPGRADIGPVLATVVRQDRQSRVRQAALAAMQRSWRYEPAILDAIASRADEETAYTYVIRLIEYLATTWREHLKARDLVIKLAARKPKARYEYDNDAVIKAAGQALVKGWGNDPQTLPWLRNHVTDSQNTNVRQAAIWAIAQGWRNDPQTLPWLRDCATNDRDTDVRQAAIEAIAQGWRNDAQTLPWLLDLGIQDTNVRRIASRTIAQGWGGELQTLAWLRNRATNDQNADVRQAAIEAIARGWGGEPQMLAWLRDRATNDQAAAVRQAAIWAIAYGWRGEPQMLAWLRDRANHDQDNAMRWAGV